MPSRLAAALSTGTGRGNSLEAESATGGSYLATVLAPSAFAGKLAGQRCADRQCRLQAQNRTGARKSVWDYRCSHGDGEAISAR